MRNKKSSIIVCAIAIATLAILYYPMLKEKMASFPQFKKPLEIQKYSMNQDDRVYSRIDQIGNLRIEEVAPATKVVPTDKLTIPLNARAACLLDASSNRLLYGKNQDTEMPMASTTKIMTLILILENAKLEDIVTVSKLAARQPDVQLNMNTGDQFKLEDLLYSLMLESHNDTAVALAEHVGGSVEGFATMMNSKAKELGCYHTNFVTPNGLDSSTEEHYTTARELGIIASYAIKNRKFREIISQPNWTFKELTKGKTYQVVNKDRFLYIYDGAIGIKTGYTNKAGYCFVGGVEKNNKSFISVVLASGWPPNKSYKWTDTTKLMDYGKNNFEIKEIFDDSKLYEPVFIIQGKESYADLYCEGSLQLLVSELDEIKVVYEINKEMKSPVKQDQVAGTAKYYINSELVKEFPILIATPIDKIDFAFTWDQIFNVWLIGN